MELRIPCSGAACCAFHPAHPPAPLTPTACSSTKNGIWFFFYARLSEKASLRSSLQNPRNGRDLPLPLFCFRAQLLPARFCERVVFRSPVIFRRLPFALDEPRALKPAKRREQRSRVDVEYPAAQLLNSLRNPPSMERLKSKRLEDQHIERSLHERSGSIRHRLSLHSTVSCFHVL